MDINIWKWLTEKRYTIAEIKQLIEEIKTFKAGVIDEHLNKHVDAAFDKWIKERE